MTTNAFVAGVELWKGDGGSPQSFTRICPLFGLGGIGEEKEQIDATTFCSNGVREYIAGLADGTEVTLQLNLETVGVGAQQILEMIADQKAGRTRSFELRVYGDISNPTAVKWTLHMDLVMLSWVMNLSPSEKNTVNLGTKISGAIDITTP